MSEAEAQKKEREKHEAWEKQQARDGHAVHLPRAGENTQAPEKKKPEK